MGLRLSIFKAPDPHRNSLADRQIDIAPLHKIRSFFLFGFAADLDDMIIDYQIASFIIRGSEDFPSRFHSDTAINACRIAPISPLK